jgi:hypothetical protein
MTCTDKECCYHGQAKAGSCECVGDKAAAAQEAKDAQRYRWLRQFPTHFGTPLWGIYGAGLPLDRVFIDRAERLDAAIDAAIAATTDQARQP